MIQKFVWFTALLLLLSSPSGADPFPPNWDNGSGSAIHHSPAPWPTEPVNAADCGNNCGQWKSYTRFQNSINDPRSKDDSNGGTAPQNYVNIASSCVDKDQPSIYYYLHQGATEADDVIMFRWRVEQVANTYATGPNAGSFSASNPWSSALWTVLFDIDGSGYRSLAAHLNGSSGNPGESIDTLAGIWSQSPKQSIDYINDPSVHLLGHNPTAFIDQGSGSILNFQSSLNPVASWPNGSSETTWDYGTTRARLVSTRSCNEYFVDYQIPVAMLDATGLGGPKITRSTPISMMFCTANSLNNPFQKDCAINKEWAADSNKPAPFGDYISFDKTEPYSQPIVAEVTAIAPSSCGQDYQLTAKVQDVLALVNGEVQSSVKAVEFYYWYDANGSGDADEVAGEWVSAASATQISASINSWTANWNASNLPKGRYLIGVQAVDDNTLVDNDMTPSGIDNRTFSYVAGNAQSQVYIDDVWIAGQQALFPNHNPIQTPSAAENWYGNPEVTGIQTALVGVALNTCGVAPSLSVAADVSEVAPGGAVTFSITVSNAGNPDAITVDSISNTLPDGFSYQSSSTTGDFSTTEPVISSQNLSWTFGSPVSVASNSSAVLNFTATASTVAGNYNNTATASTSFGDDLVSDPVAVAVGSAGLALSITPDTFSTSPSGQVTYTLNYSNPSTVAVAGVTLSSTLPADTTFQSCSDSCSNGAAVSWSLATLAPGETGSVSLVLDIDPAYSSNSLTTSASLSGTDPASNPVSATGQNTIFVNVPVSAIAAFTLDKSASALQIAPGANVTYTLNYQNYGGASGTNAVITDTLPAGMTYVSCTGGTSCGAASGIVTWNIGTVSSSGTGSVTVIVTADNPFESPNPAVNTADINWDGGSAVSATANLGVTGLSCSAYYFRDTTSDVGFDGTDRIATTLPVPLAGDTGTSIPVTAPFSGSAFLEATRFYQDPATGVDTDFSGTVDSSIFIDRAPGSGLDLQASLYDYNSVSGTKTLLGTSVTGFGGNTTGELAFSVPVVGTLQKAHRLLWIIEVRSQHASKTVAVEIQYNGTVTNGISSGTTFANSNGSFCVTPPANLTMDKTVNLATVPESTTTAVVYSIDFANLGSSDATGVTIVDTLPTGISLTSATLNGSSITPTGSNPYTFTVDTDGTSGTAVAGNSGTLVINASVTNTATGLLTNTALLSSDQTSAISDTADTLVGAPTSGGGPTAPEIYMSKIVNSSLLGASDTVTYSLTAVNAGSADATNVVVTDDFPEQAYFSYVSCATATGSCSETPTGTLNWNVGTLSAGGSATLTYSMQVAATGIPNGITQLSSNADASDDDYCSGGTPPVSCSSETVNVSISGNPDLAIILSADNAAVVPGDLIEYTVLVTNNGSSTANEVTVSNPIPDNTGFVEITSGTGSFDLINNQVLFNAATLASGASVTYVFTVQVVSPLASGDTTITDTATVSAVNAAAVSDSVMSTATATPAISLSLSGAGNIPLPATTLASDAVSNTTINVVSAALLSAGDTIRINSDIVQIISIAGNQLLLNSAITASTGVAIELAETYSISYQNTGDAAATNVQVSEALPIGWLYVASSPAATTAPALGSNGTVSWTLGTVAAGASGSLQFVALPTTSGSVTQTITLTADDAINVPATKAVLVGGLTVQKIALSDHATLGGTVDYTITVSNSLSVPVTGITVVDILPAGLSYASSTTTPTDVSDLSVPEWTVDVAANSSTSIDFTVDVSADAGAANYQNEVQVTKAGIGVSQFDALASTAEDVTVLVNSGLVSGVVLYDNAPMSGIWVNFYDTNVLAYKVYTDTSGRYQQVLEVGANWRIELSSDNDNDAQLAGLSLTAGTDPEDFAVVSDDSLTRDFTYSLSLPTVNSQVSSDTTPVITGTYASIKTGAVLSVTVNGKTYSVGTDLVISGDDWTLTIPLLDALSDNTYEVVASVSDGDHSSTDASSGELEIDTVLPAVPTVNNLTANAAPVLTGTAALGTGESLSVAVNGAVFNNVTVTTGNWSLDTGSIAVSSGTLGSFVDGSTHEITATITDAANNDSVDISSNELSIDTTAPAVPTVDSQSSSGSPVITGSAILAAGETLSVVVNGATYDNVSVTGGVWSIDTASASVSSGTLGSFDNGVSYSVIATVTDAAGNTAVDISSSELVLDTVPPVVPTVNSQTSSGAPVLTGSATLGGGETLSVTVNGATYDNVTVNTGVWSLDTGSVAVSSGTLGSFVNGVTYDVTATASDAAGNTSVDVTSAELEIDMLAPVVPTVNSQTSSGNPVLTGSATLGSGETLSVEVNGATYENVTVTTGNWSLDTGSIAVSSGTLGSFVDGNNYDITATVTDAAGNSSVDVTSAELLIANTDTDGDGITDIVDLDDDNDGIPDSLEGNGAVDTDGDGIADSLDLDSDNDGLFDLIESGAPNVSTLDADNNGQIDGGNAVGSNGLADIIETVTDSGTLSYNGGGALDTDSDGVEDFRDLDSDNDGIPDVTESGGSDPDGDGIMGSGVPTVDADGLATGSGLTPTDSDGDGFGDQLELDADNDGINDLVEAGGVDSNNDGLVDGFTDINGDGFDDGLAATPLPLTDTDNDGIPDYQDKDDADNDGIPDSADLDDDNDGIPDTLEGSGAVDTDGDGIADSLDLDSDNDGLFDMVESGVPNVSTLDANDDGRIDNANNVGSNGIADAIETAADSGVVSYNGGSALDSDSDGIEDFRDLDSDNDGIPDVIESGGSDPDGDGIIGTGTPTVNNSGLANAAGSSPIDTDGDGLPDQLDVDADNDGEFDLVEAGGADSNNDGLVDDFTDTNGDGFDDGIAATPLLLKDTDGDNIPDYLDTVVDTNNVIRTGVNGIGVSNLWLLMLLMSLPILLRRYTLIKLFGFGFLLSISFGANSAAADEDANETFQQRVYIGAGIGYSLMAPETDGTIYSVKDENDFGYKLYVGFDLNQYISAELSMSDLGTTTLNPTGEIDYSITAFNALYYFYDQNENDHQGWASYIKGGLGSINNSANVPYQKENSVQVTLGAGIEYAWKNGLAARLDLESFDDDASLLTVGLLYRFGKKAEKKPEPEDKDKDGVLDNNDQCPNTVAYAEVNQQGCEKDADKDGVVDRLDACPETPEGEKVDEKGCSTDVDGDGVLNDADQCPDTVKGASVNATGCAIFETSLEGVSFEIGSAELTEGAKLVLDKAAEAFLQITTVRVEVQAHTDSVGKKQSNQKLSDARAISVADYLESKGVKRDRMETKGYGETKPRASNKTPEERAKNRRVEFRVLSQKHME